MKIEGLAARRSALWLLWQVSEGRLLSELLPKALERLDPPDRARAQRLAVTTLRWADRADRMLGPYLKARPEDAALNALRLGVVELAVEGAPAHGVINALVEILRRGRGTRRTAGLVNAVLRKIANNLDTWDTLPLPRLPKALRKPLIAAYGKAATEAIEAAHAKGAALDITAKANPERVADMLGGTVLPTGSIRLANAGQVSALPGFDTGDWWVQDAAAALPAQILNVQEGERTLDMCAAPGGKTMQLAATGSDVTALDISEDRMTRVRENLSRVGLEANCKVADALTFDAEPFDAILLDAPCSATGTIRRHPDLPMAKAKADFADLYTLQSQMLDKAVGLLKPGGRLIYCTCSLVPDEGEAQITTALERQTAMKLDLDALKIDGIDRAWVTETGLRLRPDYWLDLGGMDGFFIAALRKSS